MANSFSKILINPSSLNYSGLTRQREPCPSSNPTPATARSNHARITIQLSLSFSLLIDLQLNILLTISISTHREKKQYDKLHRQARYKTRSILIKPSFLPSLLLETILERRVNSGQREKREERKGGAVKRGKRIVKRWKALDRWWIHPLGFPGLSATGHAALREPTHDCGDCSGDISQAESRKGEMPDLSLCAQVCVCVCVERGSGVPVCIRLVGRRRRNKAAVCKYWTRPNYAEAAAAASAPD